MFEEEALIKEFNFKAIRSSGAGGQHVNKVSSKIELSFNLETSLVLNENQKQVIKLKLSNRINKDGLLILQCGESRSQHKNKNIAIKRIIQVLKSALYIQKRRIPTKTPKAVVFKRLKNKRVNKERKANRSKPRLD
ncbi:alternative ribosome rescue aminoacyl-tRNA hydrolase ArfB [Lacinutrix sp.]|uniref:alternative ribosome rescue aminoacyl-tRNA hydrolase ArfB n=1 Tax=Lacinutrix sp. TaxID=1937692 RepID=UPI002602049B|nr:alternative ribosome rescue aminoacyl-tRNA hydrolase ArfB [Lacinutrix sp.]MDG1715964.1 alternative ribosome rescue aminoacyl-tRNA hydrolase ArfB [Lacinutrix sp.]